MYNAVFKVYRGHFNSDRFILELPFASNLTPNVRLETQADFLEHIFKSGLIGN